MTDDDTRPVNLKEFKARRYSAAYNKAYDQFCETARQGLLALWAKCAAEPAPHAAELLGIFDRLLNDLVKLAQEHGADNKTIRELLNAARPDLKRQGR
jgi:hypothetical protein